MRSHHNKPKPKVQHHYQHMIPYITQEKTPWIGLIKCVNAFAKSLQNTKRWAMGVDFDNNVAAALAREKKD